VHDAQLRVRCPLRARPSPDSSPSSRACRSRYAYSVAPRPEPLESYAHHILDAAIAAARAAAGFRPPFTTSTSWRQFRVPAAFRARLGLAKAFAPVSTAEWAVVHGDAPAAGAARSATGSDLKLAA
jgi:hypothetical protein